MGDMWRWFGIREVFFLFCFRFCDAHTSNPRLKSHERWGDIYSKERNSILGVWKGHDYMKEFMTKHTYALSVSSFTHVHFAGGARSQV